MSSYRLIRLLNVLLDIQPHFVNRIKAYYFYVAIIIGNIIVSITWDGFVKLVWIFYYLCCDLKFDDWMKCVFQWSRKCMYN